MTVTNRKPTVQNDAAQGTYDKSQFIRPFSNQTCSGSRTRITPDECRVTNIDLCPSCFCKGKEVGKHRASHPYRVIERHSYPIFTEDWGADEELLLVDGLLASGMGSWADAAEHIGTRTREEVEKHYNEVYVNSEDWPLPDMNSTFDFDFETFQARKKRRIEEIRKVPTELPAVAPKPLVSAPTNHEIAGYMPGRLEFETEVDNEAEEQVKDLEFGLVMEYGGADQPEGDPPASVLAAQAEELNNPDGDNDGDVKMSDKSRGANGHAEVKAEDENAEDAPPEPLQVENPSSLKLKLCLLSMYNEKINKRLETKAVVFDRGLLEFKKLQAIERKRQKEERDFIHKHKPFARLQTAADYEVFIDGLLYEVALRKRIQELQEYRRMGITTFAEADKYEKDKIARQLCSQLRVLPKPYLAIKETLLREYAKKGGRLRKREAKDMFKADTQKTVARIWDFLEKSGIFKPLAPISQAATTALGNTASNTAGGSALSGAIVSLPGHTSSAPPSTASVIPPQLQIIPPPLQDVIMLSQP
ncbi:Transcriptional adapter ada2 [Tulasnella sp. 403]|nr:Transcriptional adapter ada2 [Tulasnella sp. 403]